MYYVILFGINIRHLILSYVILRCFVVIIMCIAFSPHLTNVVCLLFSCDILCCLVMIYVIFVDLCYFVMFYCDVLYCHILLCFCIIIHYIAFYNDMYDCTIL